MIVVGALAYRSATYIFGEIRGGFAARLAIAFRGRLAREFLKLYVITGLPIAFVNGFLIRFSWIDGVIVGIGTWIGTFAAILLARRFNPVILFCWREPCMVRGQRDCIDLLGRLKRARCSGVKQLPSQ